MIVSERIFDIMQRRKMSQKEFSMKTGIAQSTVSDWKNKGTNPASDKIMIICEALDISPFELLSGNEACGASAVEYAVADKGTDEYYIVEMFRKLDNSKRQRIVGYVQALCED